MQTALFKAGLQESRGPGIWVACHSALDGKYFNIKWGAINDHSENPAAQKFDHNPALCS
jgi:hypothetical protein